MPSEGKPDHLFYLSKRVNNIRKTVVNLVVGFV